MYMILVVLFMHSLLVVLELANKFNACVETISNSLSNS